MEDINEGSKLFQKGKRTHKLYFTKKSGQEALSKKELDHIKKSLYLDTDRASGTPKGWTGEHGRRIFDVYVDSKDPTKFVVSSIFDMRDEDMGSFMSKTLKRLGYKDIKNSKGTFTTSAKSNRKHPIREGSRMKTFKEYIELKEEEDFSQEMLNEEPLTMAGAVLGYAIAGLALGWGGALTVQGYSKLASKTINGIKNTYRKFFKKNKSPKEIKQTIDGLRTDTQVRTQKNKQDDEAKKYAGEMNDVNKAIKEKDAELTKEKLKDVKIDRRLINRLVITEVAKTFGEPPLHYGNTGNDAYLFVKKVLGIKVAQAASIVVKKAFEDKSAELVKNVE